jgi:uncharacterized protein (DUF58 family)
MRKSRQYSMTSSDRRPYRYDAVAEGPLTRSRDAGRMNRMTSGRMGLPAMKGQVHDRVGLGLTKGGWACLALAVALLSGGYVSGVNMFFLIGSMPVAVLLVSVVMVGMPLTGLCVRRELPDEITATVPFRIRLLLTRAKGPLRVAGAVTIEEEIRHTWPSVPPARLACVCSDLSFDTPSLCACEATVPHRGEYHFTPANIVSRFPFGLVCARMQRSIPQSFVAYPRRGRLLGIPRIPSAEERARRPARPTTPDTDFHSLRPYRAGDDRRLIHWRTSARLARLAVREQAATLSETPVVLLLDLCVPRNGANGMQEISELAVSFAATLGEALLAKGHVLSIVSGRDRMEFTACRRALLRYLARVRMADHASPFNRGSTVASSCVSGCIAIVADPGRALVLRAMGICRVIYVPGEHDFQRVFDSGGCSKEARA